MNLKNKKSFVQHKLTNNGVRWPDTSKITAVEHNPIDSKRTKIKRTELLKSHSQAFFIGNGPYTCKCEMRNDVRMILFPEMIERMLHVYQKRHKQGSF